MRFTSLEMKPNDVLIKMKVMLTSEMPIRAMDQEVVLYDSTVFKISVHYLIILKPIITVQ